MIQGVWRGAGVLGVGSARQMPRGIVSRAGRVSRMGRAGAPGLGFAGLVHLRPKLDCRVAGTKECVRRNGLEQTTEFLQTRTSVYVGNNNSASQSHK